MTLIDALAGTTAADEVLGEQVRFRSPYADYAGRADVAHLVGLIREVLVEFAPVQTLQDDATAMTLFAARVAEHDVQGVLVERHDDAGRVVDAMLTLRPYAGLRAAMGAMQARMETSPLPNG